MYQYFIQITVSVCECVCVCVCVTEVMHFRVIASAFNEAATSRAVVFCALSSGEGSGDGLWSFSLTLPPQVSQT